MSDPVPGGARLVVVLFSDVVASTKVRSLLGDRLADLVMAEHEAALR